MKNLKVVPLEMFKPGMDVYFVNGVCQRITHGIFIEFKGNEVIDDTELHYLDADHNFQNYICNKDYRIGVNNGYNYNQTFFDRSEAEKYVNKLKSS